MTLDKHFKQTFCELIYNWKFPEPTQIRQNVVKSDVKKSQICPILHWSLDTKLGSSMTNDLKEAKPVLNPEHGTKLQLSFLISLLFTTRRILQTIQMIEHNVKTGLVINLQSS